MAAGADPLDANNVSPRLGVAWAPGDGKTVVRASGGVYFDRIPLRATSNALQRDGTNYQIAVLSFGQAGAPVFPAVLPAFPAGVLVSDQQHQPGHPEPATAGRRRCRWSARSGRRLSAQAGYSYLRGHGIIMSRNINVPTLTAAQAAALGVANLGRPNPAFGNISQYEALGDAWFDGLTLSLDTRHAAWGGVRVSYTLSKAETMRATRSFRRRRTRTTSSRRRGRRTTISAIAWSSAARSATRDGLRAAVRAA